MSEFSVKAEQGKVLKRYRIKHKKTQREIAELLGISTATYCKKEYGHLAVSLSEAKMLADFYETTIDEFFFSNQIL